MAWFSKFKLLFQSFYGGSIFIQKYLNLFISKIGKNQNNFAVAKEICNGNDIVFEQKSGQGNELRQKTYSWKGGGWMGGWMDGCKSCFKDCLWQ